MPMLKSIRNNLIYRIIEIINIIWRKIFSLLFILVLFNNNVKSQFLDDEVCLSGGNLEIDYRRKPWKGNNPFLIKYLDDIKYFDQKEKVRFLVPIKFWVYHDKNGNGGASISDIKVFINDLNQYNSLNQTGFQFYTSEIRHINNSNRQVFGYFLETTFQTLFRHTKTSVNVYLIDAFKKKQESRKVVKGTFNMITKSIVIQQKNSSTGLTHEVGHYFGLLHPHRHFDKGKSKQEPVSRIRKQSESKNESPLCEKHGDFLADTKAEPKLTFLVDNNCKFTGQALKDAWGDNYQSEVNNIMSYPTHYSCRDSFTISQKAVMLYSAAKNKYGRFWNTEEQSNSKYIFDKNEPDDYMEWAGNLDLGVKQYFNFHKIFMGKNEDRNDTCDWIKFQVKPEDKRNVKISIFPGTNNDNKISATFYDKNLIALSKNKIAKAGETIEFGFSGLVSDWYYIHVLTNKTKSKHVDDYSVQIELF